MYILIVKAKFNTYHLGSLIPLLYLTEKKTIFFPKKRKTHYISFLLKYLNRLLVLTFFLLIIYKKIIMKQVLFVCRGFYLELLNDFKSSGGNLMVTVPVSTSAIVYVSTNVSDKMLFLLQ